MRIMGGLGQQAGSSVFCELGKDGVAGKRIGQCQWRGSKLGIRVGIDFEWRESSSAQCSGGHADDGVLEARWVIRPSSACHV